MRYKHIMWDWNGTLVDDAWLCVEIMNKSLTKRNLQTITVEDYRQVFKFPVKDYYVALGFDFQAEPFEVCGLEFIDEFKKRMFDANLHADSKMVLNSLKDGGITQSILSAQNQELLDKTVEHYNISHFFTGVNGLSDHYAHSKVEIGINWLSQLDYAPQEVVMIGDTAHDLEVAQAMGTDCILVSFGHNCHTRFSNLDVPVFHSLQEVYQTISNGVYE